MTAAEKAKELVDKFAKEAWSFHENTKWGYDKQCALICVDEIIKENERINEGGAFPTPLTEYWKEVKQEIIKL